MEAIFWMVIGYLVCRGVQAPVQDSRSGASTEAQALLTLVLALIAKLCRR